MNQCYSELFLKNFSKMFLLWLYFCLSRPFSKVYQNAHSFYIGNLINHLLKKYYKCSHIKQIVF